MSSSTSAPARASAAASRAVVGRRRTPRGRASETPKRRHGRRLSPVELISPTASSTRTAASTCAPASTRSRPPTRTASPTRSCCSTTPPTTARSSSPRSSPRPTRGSATALRVIALERRAGQGRQRHAAAAARRAGELCLLLNEDSELLPGAAAALIAALRADPSAGAAGAQLLDPAGDPQPCAWRLPGVGTALAQALLPPPRLVTESGGSETRRVGWAQSAALLVRRSAAEQVGYLDPDFFVYSDETDFCKRLGDAGCATLYVPAARAIHHEQLATDRSAGRAPGRRVPPQPRPLHAQAPRPGRRPRWSAPSRPSRTCRGRSRRWSCPATTRAGTSCTRARHCVRAARGCGSWPSVARSAPATELRNQRGCDLACL